MNWKKADPDTHRSRAKKMQGKDPAAGDCISIQVKCKTSEFRRKFIRNTSSCFQLKCLNMGIEVEEETVTQSSMGTRMVTMQRLS